MVTTRTPRLLDLFCGAGGAAKGYQEAGFYVVGVDIEDQPNYCGDEFYQGDALVWLTERWLADFDVVHASPPCQRWSTSSRNRSRHPDYIGLVRNALSGRPYVIENVPGAPLEGWIVELCGSMFGLPIQRHRRFELSMFPMVLAPGACNHKAWPEGRPWTVTGKLGGKQARYDHSWKPTLDEAREWMDVPWMETAHEVAEAIPPAYSKFIGEAFLSQRVEV